jgi:hypothetical protein
MLTLNTAFLGKFLAVAQFLPSKEKQILSVQGIQVLMKYQCNAVDLEYAGYSATEWTY